MNLLDTYIPTVKEKILDPDIIFFRDFRQNQYDMIRYFCELCVDYISKQNGNFLKRISTTIKPEYKYDDFYGYILNNVQVKVKDSSTKSGKKTILSFKIPDLIDGAFFYLKGSYYCPTCYILDKPISIKKNSIMIYGLFNSLTIYTKNKRAIFLGHNIPISYFLPLLENEKLQKEFETKFNLKHITHSEATILKYYSDKFECKPTMKSILEQLNNFILDDYTKKLYSACYNMKKVSVKKILKKAIKMSLMDKQPSFVNLDNKRIVFIELLLEPIFKKCSSAAIQASKKFNINSLECKSNDVLKNFSKKLDQQFLYESVNMFSGLSIFKCAFLNPGSSSAPSSIASIHKSHFNTICPITMSAQTPGETVSIVPDLKINKIGLFLNE